MYKGIDDVFTKKKHDVRFGQSMYLFLAILIILSSLLAIGFYGGEQLSEEMPRCSIISLPGCDFFI